MEIEEEKALIKEFLSDSKLKDFVVKNLKDSLKSIGYSQKTVEDLIELLDKMDIRSFQEKHSEELHEVHSIGFFQKIVPEYFGKYVVPHIPNVNKILDIGCGTGILAHVLSKSRKFKQIIGIDLNEYPEWEEFADSNTEFKIVKQEDFNRFLIDNKPDAIVMTWTLHHMKYEEQENYLKNIYDLIEKIKIITLEDAYSENLSPKSDIGVYDSFMAFDKKERNRIMSVFDWIANRVLERRDKVPIPFGYRTVEDWRKLFEKIGFKVKAEEFIGFPENRDVNTPQSLMVIEK